MQLKDYGTARQITLFEHGQVALQILTSDTDSCPAEILSWLRSRWREENFSSTPARTTASTRSATTSRSSRRTRKSSRTGPRESERRRPRRREDLTTAERDLATLIADPAISVAAKNTTLIPAAQRTITAARRKHTAAAGARDAIPAKLPANAIDPDAEVALLRAGRGEIGTPVTSGCSGYATATEPSWLGY